MSIPPPDAWLQQQSARFGDRLRSLRKQRRLTQEALAERAGLDRQTIGNIENANHATRVDTAFALAWALQVPPEVLFGDGPIDSQRD